MQLSRIAITEETAYMFAKLKMAYGGKSTQRTFDEILITAWYLITQNAVPPQLTIPHEEPTAVETDFNFAVVGENYVQMFVEIKRRLSLSKRHSATNSDAVEHVVRLVYII